MITAEDCRCVMDAYRNRIFKGWKEGPNGERIYDMGLVILRHMSGDRFELDMGRGWIPVVSIEWRFSIHVKIDGAELIIGRRDG